MPFIQRGMTIPPEHRARLAESNRRSWTPERRAAQAERARKQWQDPEYRAKNVQSLKETYADEGLRQHLRDVQVAHWTPERRVAQRIATIGAGFKRGPVTAETRRKLSAAALRQWRRVNG